MFTESEIDENIDFNPRNPWGFALCKECKHWEICPAYWECPSKIKWECEDEDLDNDDTL